MVWNTYLGQTRWIGLRTHFDSSDIYVLGYDNNHNHKILRLVHNYFGHVEFEMYDFSSDSRSVLDVTPDPEMEFYQCCETLKGNAYFFAEVTGELEYFLICFDFTRERFGKCLPLPFDFYPGETVMLSCVREEQLAVLYQECEPPLTLEIWVTNKNIDPNAVAWSKFLVVDMAPLTGFRFWESGCFFIDEEKKVAVVFDEPTKTCGYQIAYIIGEDGYFKSVKLEDEDARMPSKCNVSPARVSSGYLPSLVQITKEIDA